MRPFQLSVFIGLLAALAIYLTFFRSSLRDRMIALGFFFSAAAVAIFPGLSDQLVAIAGIGRSTDVFIYLFSLASLFCIILLYSKAHKLERDVTQVVRHLAIANAVRPAEREAQERTVVSLASRTELP